MFSVSPSVVMNSADASANHSLALCFIASYMIDGVYEVAWDETVYLKKKKNVLHKHGQYMQSMTYTSQWSSIEMDVLSRQSESVSNRIN